MTKDKKSKIKTVIIVTVISITLVAAGVGLILAAKDTEYDSTAIISGTVITDNASGKHIASVFVYNSNNLNKVIAQTETAEDGNFSIDIYNAKDENNNGIEDVFENEYTIVIKKQAYLNYTIKKLRIFKGLEAQLGNYELLAGDVDGSGEIDIDDLVTLNNNFGKQNNICDLNENGHVGTGDRDNLKSNYGKIAPVVEWEAPMYTTKRKTDIAFSELFDADLEDYDTVEYEVNGNLNFNNKVFGSNDLTNISQLELGTYEVKCTITKSNSIQEIKTKRINIVQLADTTVTNASNEEVNGYAIYSEYDLAFFRDMVNDGEGNINAKVMQDIDLTNVCDWTPIGSIKNDIGVSNLSEMLSYNSQFNGIFDGNYKNINNLKFNDTTTENSFGLFGAVKTATIKNCIINNVDIKGNRVVGALAGYITRSTIQNCKSSGQIQGTYGIGGLIGFINQSTIYSCKNEANIIVTSNGNNFGGICGVSYNNTQISYCYNTGNISGPGNGVGGIAGRVSDGGTVKYIYNNGLISSSGSSVGGIIGNVLSSNSSSTYSINIENCYNLKSVTGNKSTTTYVGGIIGNATGNSSGMIYLKNAYNKGSINSGVNVGGLMGCAYYVTIQGEILNYGSVTNYSSYAGAIIAVTGDGYANDFTKRAYGGNCSSTLKSNGTGNNNSYDANLTMPTVYSVVNATNTGEFTTTGASTENPKLKNIE